MEKVIITKKREKRRRWKHPFITKIKLWFAEIFRRITLVRKKPKILSRKEEETFIQGLIRINSQTNIKSAPSPHIRELVPYKIYKARDLLLELKEQKEAFLKTGYRRNNNID